MARLQSRVASDGALRDIQVVDATAADWQRVVDFVRARADKLDYTVDGTPAALPSQTSAVIALWATATPSLLFRWGDIDVATHFLGDNDLQFDFRADNIRGQAQLNQLLTFVSGVGRLVGKTILVYHEGWEMSPFFRYDPMRDGISYSPHSI